MYRVDTAESVGSPPTPSAIGAEAFFKDTVGANPGTLVDADWLNMLQESLIAVLDDQSIAHSKSVTTRLLDAINALVDERVALTNPGIRGLISGLPLVPAAGAATFTVGNGLARDFADSDYMRNSAGLKTKDLSVAWATGLGGMASSNTWADPYFGRIFAIGKSDGSLDINYGADQSATAANLLTDAAGDGFDTYRQIGWAIRVGAGLLPFLQDPARPDYWRLQAPRSPITSSAVPATTVQTYDLDVPEETIHVGAHTIEKVDGGLEPTPHYAILGGMAAPPLPDVNNYNARLMGSLGIQNDFGTCRNILSTVSSGTATLQGQLSSRFSTSSAIEYTISTSGFIWSREVV